MERNSSRINVVLSALFTAVVFAEKASWNLNFQTQNSQSVSGKKELDDESSFYLDLILLILAISLPIALFVCMALIFICRELPENQEEGMKEYCKQQECLDKVDDRLEISVKPIILDSNNHNMASKESAVESKFPKAPKAPNSLPKTFSSILKRAVTFTNVLASFEDDGSDKSSSPSGSHQSTKSISSDSTGDDAIDERSSSISSPREDYPQQFSSIQRKTVTFINPFSETVNRFDKPYQRRTPTSLTFSHITGILSDPDLPVVEEVIISDLDVSEEEHENHENIDSSNAPLPARKTSMIPVPMVQHDSVDSFYRRPSTLTHSLTEPGPWKKEKENVDYCSKRARTMPNLHSPEEGPTRTKRKTMPGYRSCHGSVAHLHCLYLDGESVGISLDDDIKNFEFDDYGNAYEKEMGVVFVNDDGQKVEESFKPQYGDFCR